MLLGGKPEGPGQEDDEECHRHGANQEGSQNVVFELSLDLVPRVYALKIRQCLSHLFLTK